MPDTFIECRLSSTARNATSRRSHLQPQLQTLSLPLSLEATASHLSTMAPSSAVMHGPPPQFTPVTSLRLSTSSGAAQTRKADSSVCLLAVLGLFLARLHLPRHRKNSQKHGASRDSEHQYPAPQSFACLWSRTSRRVAAQAASLCVAGHRQTQRRGQRSEHAELLHWKNTSSTNRKTQKSPIVCQYQATESTATWRNSIFFNVNSPASAAIRAIMPNTRCRP